MRLDEAVQLFVDTYDKETTRRTYLLALRAVIDIIGGGRDIEDISTSDLIRVQNYLQKKDLAAATLRQRINSVKTFFNWLYKFEFKKENPGKIIKAKRPRRPQTREKAVTDDELEMLLNFVQYSNRRDYALLLFLADTGCRVGGAAGLRESDIDWEKREATVTEKGDRTRQVKFGKSTAIALRTYLLSRKATSGNFIFSMDGSQIKSSSVSQRIRYICRGLRKQGYQIRTISAHAFRHRKGHMLADARIAPSVAATALGHESVLTTLEFYYPDDWESAASVLDELSLDRPQYSQKKAD